MPFSNEEGEKYANIRCHEGERKGLVASSLSSVRRYAVKVNSPAHLPFIRFYYIFQRKRHVLCSDSTFNASEYKYLIFGHLLYIYSNKGCSLKSLRLESTKSSRFHETPTNNDFQEGPYFIIFPVESGNFLWTLYTVYIGPVFKDSAWLLVGNEHANTRANSGKGMMILSWKWDEFRMAFTRKKS